MSPLTAERVLIFGALYFMYYSPAVADPAGISSPRECTKSRVNRQARIGPKTSPAAGYFYPCRRSARSSL